MELGSVSYKPESYEYRKRRIQQLMIKLKVNDIFVPGRA